MNSTLTQSAIRAMALVAATVLGGCAGNGPQPTLTAYLTPFSTPDRNNAGNHGSIESIQGARATNNTSGAGAAVGGLPGNQIDNGNGRTVPTVAGAVGGAAIGNNVEPNRIAQSRDMYRIRVRLDNGNSTTVTQDSIDDLDVGSRVRIVDGRVHRDQGTKE